MTIIPSSKLLKVFDVIIPQMTVIRMLWEVVMHTRGLRIFVLIMPQLIRVHFKFGEWEVVAVFRPRRGVKILKRSWYSSKLWYNSHESNNTHWQLAKARGSIVLRSASYQSETLDFFGIVNGPQIPLILSSREEIQISRQYRGVQYCLEELVKTTYIFQP